MPISAEKMRKYPGGSIRSSEWLAFRASILDRAGNACEGTPMHPDCRIPNGALSARGTKVVLTIAHMDHDATHADPDRCRALCQRCHLNWDRKNHITNAAETRRRKSPQADMFCERMEASND